MTQLLSGVCLEGMSGCIKLLLVWLCWPLLGGLFVVSRVMTTVSANKNFMDRL